MLNIAILGTLARSALLGAVATRVVDTVILSKVNSKIEEKKWLKTNKFDLFSKLSHEILFIQNSEIDVKVKNIELLSAKIAILTKNQRIIKEINNYLTILKSKKDIQLMEKYNLTLIEILNKELRA